MVSMDSILVHNTKAKYGKFITKDKNGNIGSTVDVLRNDSTIIPVNKINIYARGKVAKPDLVRLKEIKQIRISDQRAFSKNTKLQKELKTLESKKHNYERSTEMKNTLDKAGIKDNSVNNRKIMDSLFQASKSVTEGNRRISTNLDGKVKLVSQWKILPSGEKYLTTIIVIPK